MSFFNDLPFVSNVILPTLDVLLLAFIIYRGYLLLASTRAFQLLKGALFMVVMYALAFFLNLRTLLWLMNLLVPSLVIALAIIFQPELRNIFTRLGQGRLFRQSANKPAYANMILDAAETLAEHRRGALIVLSRTIALKNITETGTTLDAEISVALLLTIFQPDTSLHDGAVVVGNGRIIAAGCFLPLSEQLDVRRSFGTRHRAALGLAEESDAVTIVVSEETGSISLSYNANLYYDLSPAEIRRHIRDLLHIGEPLQEVVGLET